MPKMYLTKHALSGKGEIPAAELDVSEFASRYAYDREQWRTQYVVGRNAFLSADEALAAANVARHNKIRSLRKQIEKLENMRFRIAEGD